MTYKPQVPITLCTGCKQPVLTPRSGLYTCAECGKQFHVVNLAPVSVSSAAGFQRS